MQIFRQKNLRPVRYEMFLNYSAIVLSFLIIIEVKNGKFSESLSLCVLYIVKTV